MTDLTILHSIFHLKCPCSRRFPKLGGTYTGQKTFERIPDHLTHFRKFSHSLPYFSVLILSGPRTSPGEKLIKACLKPCSSLGCIYISFQIIHMIVNFNENKAELTTPFKLAAISYPDMRKCINKTRRKLGMRTL